MALASKLEQLMDQENMVSLEGRRGVANLCRIARALGYESPTYGGQVDSGAYLDDLFLFLEDNSGAIEAVIEWIGDQRSSEWNENITDLLHERNDDEDDDNDD